MVTVRKKRAPKYLISIDPGLSGTGVVHWENNKPVKARVMKPVMRDVREQLKHGEQDLIPRARDLARNILLEAHRYHLSEATVVIEFPEYQASADRAMGWKTGSLQRLTMLIGVIIGVMPLIWRVILVTPSGWKGQLPKDVVQRRMTNKYGAATVIGLNIKTHAWDALGIGDWALTRMEA